LWDASGWGQVALVENRPMLSMAEAGDCTGHTPLHLVPWQGDRPAARPLQASLIPFDDKFLTEDFQHFMLDRNLSSLYMHKI